ncbi:MAG: hypothetical protein LBC63_03155, partial [Holophagales bacterium]|nr:hypothetical protein [Holophagales bacterium]
MPDKQSHDSPLPILVLAVCMAGTSLAAGKAPHAVPTMDMASTTLTTMQTPNEEELKKAVTKIDAMTKATAETKRQMEATNRIAGYMKASKNMPSKLANKAVTEAQYWKDVYVLTNLELLSAKSDKTKAETAIAAAKSKATADAAAEEKKKADTKVADTKKNYDNAKKKADDAAAKARAAKKDPKVAAAKENEAAAKAKADYDAAVAAKRTSDAKATATASNAKRDETAATNAKNAARAKADTISGQKRIVEQSKGRATSAANAWEAERKRMENNPFNRACDNVDRAITDTIEKAKDDPVAAAASVVKTAIGGLDGVVTGAISAAANSAWFKGTKVGTTVDIA